MITINLLNLWICYTQNLKKKVQSSFIQILDSQKGHIKGTAQGTWVIFTKIL